MGSLTYFNAKAANGPKVAQWLEHQVGHTITQRHKDDSIPRRVNEWKQGCQATIAAVDRILFAYGFHPVELPDDVWEEPVPKGGRTKVAA